MENICKDLPIDKNWWPNSKSLIINTIKDFPEYSRFLKDNERFKSVDKNVIFICLHCENSVKAGYRGQRMCCPCGQVSIKGK